MLQSEITPVHENNHFIHLTLHHVHSLYIQPTFNPIPGAVRQSEITPVHETTTLYTLLYIPLPHFISRPPFNPIPGAVRGGGSYQCLLFRIFSLYCCVNRKWYDRTGQLGQERKTRSRQDITLQDIPDRTGHYLTGHNLTGHTRQNLQDRTYTTGQHVRT